MRFAELQRCAGDASWTVWRNRRSSSQIGLLSDISDECAAALHEEIDSWGSSEQSKNILLLAA